MHGRDAHATKVAMLRMLSRILIVVLSIGGIARAADDAGFASRLDLDPLKSIAVRDHQVVKTFDSFARQALTTITGRGSLDGKPAVYTVLDMSSHPGDYEERNIIKVRSVPLRQDFQRLQGISAA